MPRYRLVLCDLDGTLLDERRGIHAANVRALRRAMDEGVLVGFATGRSPRSVRPYAAIVQPNAPHVHMNGALVFDAARGEAIFQRELAPAAARASIELARAHGFHVNVYVGTDIWVDENGAVSKQSEIKDNVPHTVVGDVVGALAGRGARAIKLLCIGEPARIPALTGAIAAALGAGVALVNSEPDYLEVLPPGCNKLEGARALCAHLGIALDEVIAFGDNKNDLELLLGVGLGVAMGNAHPEVLAQVAVHAGDHTGDAIAAVLERALFAAR